MADRAEQEAERAYLEGLLNTRFNYFVLLVGALSAVLFAEEDLGQARMQWLLGLGALAAWAMTLIILRTSALLQVVLDMITRRRGPDGTLSATGEPVDPTQPVAAAQSDAAPRDLHPYAIAAWQIRHGGLWFKEESEPPTPSLAEKIRSLPGNIVRAGANRIVRVNANRIIEAAAVLASLALTILCLAASAGALAPAPSATASPAENTPVASP